MSRQARLEVNVLEAEEEPVAPRGYCLTGTRFGIFFLLKLPRSSWAKP